MADNGMVSGDSKISILCQAHNVKQKSTFSTTIKPVSLASKAIILANGFHFKKNLIS